MFTGIVSAVGQVAAVERNAERLRLTIDAPFHDLTIGESVAVSGACLTVVERGDGWFHVDAIVTTRGRTRFEEVAAGDRLNLERALQIGDRLGGHFVQGHIDGLGTVERVAERDDALLVDVRIPDDIAKITVLHGSIALDGVSLTVNDLPEADVAQVALIPFTRAETTLGAVAVGDRLHVEGDMLGKFVRRMMINRAEGSRERC